MNISEKLEVIGLSKYKDHLSNTAIDLIYEDKVLSHKKKLILSLLNKILIASNNKEIKDILEFKITIKEFKRINAIEFIDNNMNILEELKIDKNKDLQYKSRFKKKNYLVIVVKELLKICNYKLESYQSIKKTDDSKLVCFSKYRIINNT
jgi:hypothetical protein